MARFAIPGLAPLVRAGRRLWPDRNPLRRRTDRAEAAITAALLALFLGGAPVAAVTAARVSYRYDSGVVHAQQATRHRVPAVLLASVPADASVGGIWLKARWTAPDGAPRTGEVFAPPAARSGGTVMIWVDRSGGLTVAPLTRSQVASQAWLAAFIGPLVLLLMLVIAGSAAHAMLDRRRLAAWDAEWRAAGPQWTSRR